MIYRLFTISWLIAVTFVGYGLYRLKYEVQDLETELTRLNQNIREDRQASAVLEAEWAYLNTPERLEQLVRKHLAMEPHQTAQIQMFSPITTQIAPAHASEPVSLETLIMKANETEDAPPPKTKSAKPGTKKKQ